MTGERELRKKNKGELIEEVIQKYSEFEKLKKILQLQNARMHALAKMKEAGSLDIFIETILSAFPIKKSSTARLLLQDKDFFGHHTAIGVGLHQNAYQYLDRQVKDQLGGKNYLEINETSKMHNFRFLPDKPYPRSIYAFPLIHLNKKVGLIWIADQNNHGYASSDIDVIRESVAQFELAISFFAKEKKRDQISRIQQAAFDAIKAPVLVCDDQGELIFHNQAMQILIEKDNDSELYCLLKSNFSAGKKEFTFELNNDVFKVEKNDISIHNYSICYLENETKKKNIGSYFSNILEMLSTSFSNILDEIIGYASLVSGLGNMSSKQQEYLEKIKQRSDQLANQMKNIIDIKRMDHPGFLSVGEFDIIALAAKIIRDFSPILAQKQLKLSFNNENSSIQVISDEGLLRQLCLNIFESAVHAADIGSEIKFEIRTAVNKVTLVIEDNGVGLSPPDIEVIVKTKTLHKNFKELCYARSITKLLLGEIKIESQLGRGKKVIIDIPRNM